MSLLSATGCKQGEQEFWEKVCNLRWITWQTNVIHRIFFKQASTFLAHGDASIWEITQLIFLFFFQV